MKKPPEKSANQTIKLFREILKTDNIRDYIVILLVLSYTVLVFYRVIGENEKIPESFFGLVMGAFAFYFRNK